MYAIALVLLLASDPQQELKQDVSSPRQQGTPTDPLFDKAYVATDAPAFVSEARTDANFILQQISFHEATVAQLRAQLDGSGDVDLKRELREALPGYQKNLELLLRVKL